jgi:hypothetical protein
VQKTWYFPNHPDSCHFIVQKLQVFPYVIGNSVTALAIGEAWDWDVPTDSGTSNNKAYSDPTRRLVWLMGFNSADTVTDGVNNSKRAAGSAFLGMNLKAAASDSCGNDLGLYGAYAAANDTFLYPEGTFVASQLWANMQSTGYPLETRITDLHIVLTYKNVASTGYTLPANDTLTTWTVMATVLNAADSTAAKDSIKKYVDQGKDWWRKNLRYIAANPCTCCLPGATSKRGDVDQSGGNPALADLSKLINYLKGGTYVPPCKDQANVDGLPLSGSNPALADLSKLISYLKGTGYVLVSCP